MAQREIYSLLKDMEGQKITTNQLSQILDLTRGSVVHSLTKLKQFKTIKYEYIDHQKVVYWYEED